MPTHVTLNFEKHAFTPSAIAGMTGVSPDMQRDLRHKGFLANYGAMGDDQRWKYSLRDMIAFAAAFRLIKTGWHRHSACACAWTFAHAILAEIVGAEIPIRYVAHLIDAGSPSDDFSMRGTVTMEAKTLAEIEAGPSFDRAEILDLKYLAQRLPDDLKEFIADVEVNFD